MQTAEYSSDIRIEPERATIDRVGLCRTSLHLMVEAGEFPKPIYLTGRKKGYLSSEVDSWIAARVQDRDAARARAKEAAARAKLAPSSRMAAAA